jgi:hypothetical protein
VGRRRRRGLSFVGIAVASLLNMKFDGVCRN